MGLRGRLAACFRLVSSMQNISFSSEIEASGANNPA
jgi:hypothetical protein